LAALYKNPGDTILDNLEKEYGKNTSFKADSFLLLAALIWGGGLVAVKYGINGMNPLFLMAIRFTATFVIMSVIFYKRLKHVTKNDIISGVVIGILIFVTCLCQAYGLKYTTVSKQSFLMGTSVVMTPFLVWILYKKRLAFDIFIGAAISCIGIGLLTLQGNHIEFNRGDVLSLVCALCIAVSYVAVSYFVTDSDPIAFTITQVGFAALFFIVAAFICAPMPVNIPREGVFSLLYLVFLSTIGCYVLANAAQKYISSTHAAIIDSTQSVFGAFFAVLILKEKMSITMLMGCILIMAAIVFVNKDMFNKGIDIDA
jgi:drug/metabolite transporter (DMT)-like permease